MYFASHKSIQPFELHRPASVDDAVAARSASGTAVYLAGGVDLIPAMRAGQSPSNVVWLKDIPGLADIALDGDVLSIGAAATYRQIETDPAVREHLPDLSLVWQEVANIRVRLAGTIGGNIMTGSPTYDALPAAIALGARLTYATGEGETATLDAGETPPDGALLLDLRIPLGGPVRFAMDRSLKPAISLAVVVRDGGDSVTVRAAVGCAHGRAWGADVGGRHDAAALATDADQLADAFAAAMPDPVTDHNASADYRRRMARVLLARQLKALAS